MLDIFQYSFMTRAFLAGVIIAIIGPLIGNFLVIRRLPLIADTLAHIALAGVAIALLTGQTPLPVTILVTALASLLIEWMRSTKNIAGESLLAIFLPGGLALSVVLIGLSKGFNANLFSYLFGSITTVSQTDIYYILVLGVISIITISTLYQQLLYSSVDEESAKVSGIPVNVMSFVLMVLTAITISLAMRVVGSLLIGALMVIPVITAMQTARSHAQSMFLSVVYAMLAVIVGLYSSYIFDLPAGGAIVLVSLFIFGIVNIFAVKQ